MRDARRSVRTIIESSRGTSSHFFQDSLVRDFLLVSFDWLEIIRVLFKSYWRINCGRAFTKES
jgi:hypothetical protein